ncbi:T9SS type A sorting domain-containing protein [Pontibacter korlensis]|uniref:PKD domain-containing protein n=1 Tax=Pontibacter korlensis TaxID=400092 RepID=A0A0E3UXE2_9BACT|nr:T9SS type A sorting domain-containing protein [Pontibacter korlensis]AKD04182.1 hypothetical protein PKOR_15160 [Pontibacter korlensis]
MKHLYKGTAATKRSFSCLRLIFTTVFSFFICFQGYAQLEREWMHTYRQAGGNVKMKAGPDNQLVILSSGINAVGFEDRRLTKLSTEGEVVWQEHLDGNVMDLLLDQNGDAYVLGTTVSKFSAAGELLWQFNLQELGLSPKSFASDTGGNLYVAGRSADDEAALLKLNEEGEQVWQKTYTLGTALFNHQPLAIGAGGEIYLAGTEQENGSIRVIRLLKINAETGAEEFRKKYGHPDRRAHYEVNKLLADATGNIYLAGQVMALNIGHTSLLAIKLSSEGDVLWEQVSSFENRDYFADAMLGPDEGLFMMSSSQLRTGYMSFVVAKYNSEGELLWNHTFDQPVGYSSYGGAWIALPSGGLAVTGAYSPSPGGIGEGSVLLQYDQQGNEVYSEDFGQTNLEANRALALDNAGSLYLAGAQRLVAGSPTSELTVLKYSLPADCNTPVHVQLYLPPHPMQVGQQVRTTADFGDFILTEDTGIRWVWGDGSSPSVSYTAFGTSRITGEHTYTQAGIFRVGLDFSESCLMPEQDDYQQWTVIYDPGAGTVRGAGWLSSTVQPTSSLAGRDLFAFNVRYRNSKASTPTGQTLLLFGSRVFLSTSIDWLVVRGDQAVWHGEGSLNGKGKYKFIASAADAGGRGAHDPDDRLRIRIWDSMTGSVLYDNYSTGPDIYDMSEVGPSIAGGQVIINQHKQTLALSQQRAVEPLSGEEVKVYPNPFSEKAVLEFSIPTGAYQVSLYDAKGSLVKVLLHGEQARAERREVEVDGTSLTAGLYFARIVTEQGTQTVKLVLDK